MRGICWRGRGGRANEKAAAVKRRPNLVGATGFEPATTCTPYRCATKLRYAPIFSAFINISRPLLRKADKLRYAPICVLILPPISANVKMFRLSSG